MIDETANGLRFGEDGCKSDRCQEGASGLRRDSTPGLRRVSVRAGVGEEDFITATPMPGDAAESVIGRAIRAASGPDTHLLSLRILGTLPSGSPDQFPFETSVGNSPPWSWVEGSGPDGLPVAGVQVHAVRGVPVTTLALDGQPVGCVYDDGDSRHAVLAGIGPVDRSAGPAGQARQAFERLEAALLTAGMETTHLARTWLFLDRMLEWYGDLNAMRTRFFEERGICNSNVPASTGIGARNISGDAIVLDAVAVQSKNGTIPVRRVESPLQCEAGSYGSSFRRAVEVKHAGYRKLYISGTASITPDGRSVHIGDVRRQIDRSMEVVEAILRSRGMTFDTVTRAIAYLKRIDDLPLFQARCREMGWSGIPFVAAQCDVCRDELLFEVEMDAVSMDPLDAAGEGVPE